MPKEEPIVTPKVDETTTNEVVKEPEPEPEPQRDVFTVEASFYIATCAEGCTGITATGYDVNSTIYTNEGYRIIAVSTNQIPLYSIVRVTLANGDQFTAQALDTGGAIKYGKIDVLVSTTSEAIALGRQSATIEVLRYGN